MITIGQKQIYRWTWVHLMDRQTDIQQENIISYTELCYHNFVVEYNIKLLRFKLCIQPNTTKSIVHQMIYHFVYTQ